MNICHAFPGDLVKNKRVLFITTKNLDYIRNTQELEGVRTHTNSLKVIGFRGGNNFTRLARVWLALLFLPMRAFDLVWVGFLPQLVLPFFKWKFRRQIVVADLFVSLYDTLAFDRGRVSPHSRIAALLRKLDTAVCREADTVLADTRAHALYFCRTFGLQSEKVQVLYLQADSSIYYPRTVERSEQAPFTVLYFGSVLPLQGVDVILQCVRLMRKDTGIFFDLIGPVPAEMRSRYGELPNAHFTDWLPQKELAKRIAHADLCLAGHFNARIEKASRTIPGKAYIYHAMKRPMVLGENPANHELFEEDGKTVYYVRMGDAESLARVIRQAAYGERH